MRNKPAETLLALSITFLSFTLSAQEYTFKKVSEFHVESLAEVAIRDYDTKEMFFWALSINGLKA